MKQIHTDPYCMEHTNIENSLIQVESFSGNNGQIGI